MKQKIIKHINIFKYGAPIYEILAILDWMYLSNIPKKTKDNLFNPLTESFY